jgi:hypothetical protein
MVVCAVIPAMQEELIGGLQLRHKCETLPEKYLQQKSMGTWLKS